MESLLLLGELVLMAVLLKQVSKDEKDKASDMGGIFRYRRGPKPAAKPTKGPRGA